MNGWTVLNCELRTNMIKYCNCDIMCLCETHLKNDETIAIDGYKWIGNNRHNLHVNARKGSGGVGFLIKEILLNKIEILCVDKSIDGVVKLLLHHKLNGYNLILFGCYVPPENSSRGRVSHDIFSYLSTQIYQDITEVDNIVICGDLNARLGNLS